MKIAIILGTRPEIIKMAPIIKECEQKSIEHYIIHSGQHYSYNLDKVFFEQLKLPNPKYKLEVGSKPPGKQTALVIEGTEKILLKNKPDIVLVQGDTNTVLGGSLAAKKSSVLLGHVEAGLRSYDEKMPEEINRRVADHCSDFLFAPTINSQLNLIKEGILKKKITVTGNTIVDAVNQNIKDTNQDIVDKLGVESENFFLVSLHRQENVDDKQRLGNVVKGLKLVKKKYGLPIVFPIHPRTEKMSKKFGINLDEIKVIKPVDYLDFLALERNAKMVLTDSGGVQEEACILNVPCVTLRYNTERPETVKVGSNKIAGTNPDSILRAVKIMSNKKRNWKNPFGDGKSASRILKILGS